LLGKKWPTVPRLGMHSIQRAEVFRAGSIPIAANDVYGEDGIPKHTHEYLEIAIVSRGRGSHVTHDGRVPIEVGSVVLIRPGTWHSYQDADHLWTFNLYLAPELLHHELAWIHEYPELSRMLLRGLPNLGRLSEARTAQVLGWLEQIRTISAGRRPSLVGLCSCILDTMQELTSRAPRDPGTVTIAKSVVTMMQLMREDLSAKWTVDDLARAINSSGSYVYRAFRSNVGLSPMAWLQQERGEMFSTLLTNTNRSVSEIGSLVSWDDPNYASRRFRALYGMTPSEYRKRFAGEDFDSIAY